MSQSARQYKRKDVFSNLKVQLKIVLVFAVLAILFVAVNYYIGKRLLTSLSDDVMRLSLAGDSRSDLALMLEQHGQTLEIQLAVFTFLSIFVLLIGGVLLSHRIGGPLYQLRKYMREVAQGTVEPRRIRFRKHDFFHELAASFNEFQVSKGLLTPDGNDQ